MESSEVVERMPVTCQIRGDVVRIRASAHYSVDDVFDAAHEGLESHGRAERVKLLVDLTESKESRTHEEIQDIADRFGALRAKTAGLAVIASDPMRYGLSRMMAAYAELQGHEIPVFRSEDEVAEWLAAE